MISKCVIENENFVYVDKCAFTGKSFCKRRWIGRRSRQYIKTKRSEPRLNLVLAISDRGVVNFKLTKKNSNADQIATFISVTGFKLKEFFTESEIDSNGITFVLDNARYHLSEQVFTAASLRNLNAQLLPPYSPELNAAEYVFAFLKQKLSKMPDLSS